MAVFSLLHSTSHKYRRTENTYRSGDSQTGQPFELLLNPWADKKQPGKLKHLHNHRKKKKSKSDSRINSK